MPPDGEVTQADRDALKNFVESTQSLLDELVRYGGPEKAPRLIPKDITELMEAAWPPVNSELTRLSERIANAPESSLISHGLYGAQLKFKLAVIDRIRRRFFASISEKWLKRLLKAIDNLIDSLSAALGIGAMAKEFKVAIEDLLEELADKQN